MAKSDFCFTYYDGDAARDMQHMDRLTRGGYTDLLLSQRKFGAMTLDFIKRILGRDFEVVWPQIEIICKQTDDGKFFIEWLEKSEIKAKFHSLHQSENGKKGGRPSKESQLKPNLNQSKTQKKPLGDGDGDGDGDENKDENFGKSENLLIVPEMLRIFKNHNPNYLSSESKDYRPLFSIASYLCEVGKLSGSPDLHRDQVLEAWEPICKVIKADKFYSQKSLVTISNHIQEILQISLHGKSTDNKPNYGSKERAKEYDRLFAERYGKG